MSNNRDIIAAIDERLAEIKPEVDRLVAARLALTEDTSPRPARQRVTAKTARRRRQPTLTVERALEPVREAIADEPTKMQELCKAVGYSRGTSTENVIRRCLEQLRAEQTRDGWVLPSPDGNGDARAAVVMEVPPEEVEQAYLERRIVKELRNGPLLPYVLADMIDAPRKQVIEACEHLHVDGQLEHMADGRYAS